MRTLVASLRVSGWPLWRPLVVTALLGLMAAWPEQVAACQCGFSQYPNPREAFTKADAVFIGTVVAIAKPSWLDYFGTTRVVLEVHQSWRGVGWTRVTVLSAPPCGAQFVAGKRYLVYADWHDGNWHAFSCTRTALTANAAADLAFLQSVRQLALHRPSPTSPPPSVHQLPASPLCGWGPGIMGILMAALIAVWQRQGR